MASPAASWGHQHDEQPGDLGGAINRRPAPAGQQDQRQAEGGGGERVDRPHPSEQMLRTGQVGEGEANGVLGKERVGQGGDRPGGRDQDRPDGDGTRPDGEAAVEAGTERAAAVRPEGGEGQRRQQQQRVDQVERHRHCPWPPIGRSPPGGEHQPGADERLADDGSNREHRRLASEVTPPEDPEHPHGEDTDGDEGNPARHPVSELDGARAFEHGGDDLAVAGGHDSPHPAPDPVALTSAPSRITTTLIPSVTQAKRTTRLTRPGTGGWGRHGRGGGPAAYHRPSMDIRESAEEAIGRTPLIRLSRLHPPGNLVAKVEMTSIGGSIRSGSRYP